MDIIKEKIKRNKISLSLGLFFGLTLMILFYAINTQPSKINNIFQKTVLPAKAQTTSLYLVNINVTALTATTATLTWETNLPADSEVKYGLTDAYELSAACGSCRATDLVTTHRITIGNLEEAKTYHYQVISTAGSETKTSQDRNFQTPKSSGSADTTAPFVTFIKVDSTDTEAIVNINTNEETHVTVYYNTLPDVTTASANVAEPSIDPYRIGHALSFGVARGTLYYYRIYSVDQTGNNSITAIFDFTSSTTTDHVFSTGMCPGNVPLGACTADGNYCDVGTGTLIKNCGQCGYNCPSAQTCRSGGDCTNDPTLTGDPYQCNTSACYDSANLFAKPATANCYASYPRCDANVILKVKRDRECAKWFTCGTGIEQVNPKTNQSEELCLNLAVCTSLGESGQCNSYAELPKAEMTYRTPSEINKIKYLTGSLTAGLDWQYQPGSPIIKGYYPWSAMNEVGEKIPISNYNFEEITNEVEKGINLDGRDPLSANMTYDIGLWKDTWQTYADPASTTNPKISSEWDPETGENKKENHVLKIQQISALNQGVAAKLDVPTSAGSNGPNYVLSLKIKASSSEEQKVTFALANNTIPGGSAPDVSSFGEYTLSTGWQTILTKPIKGVGGSDNYLRIYVSAGSLKPFYIDDVKIQPVLEAGSGVYLQRSCRLYPKEDSPACEYVDDNGIQQKGWYGYCLQRDPKNDSLCLSWWPVDILYGESNLFGSEQAAGYTGRKPLYYCLDSTGNAEMNYTIQDTQTWTFSDVTGYIRRYNRAPQSPAFNQINRLYEYEINSIDFVEQSSDDAGDWHVGTVTLTKENDWYALWGFTLSVPGVDTEKDQFDFFWDSWDGAQTYCGGEPHNIWGAHAIFDPVTKVLLGFDLQANDCSGGSGWVITRPVYHLNEPCQKIIKVVDDGGTNAAWAETINSQVYQVPDLNYQKTTDLEPYGGAVTSSSDPQSWSTPLYAEDPNNFTEGLNLPYQLRAGKPYACISDCSTKLCWGGGTKDRDPCISNSDCLDKSVTPNVQGLCFGVGTCVLPVNGVPRGCTDNSVCTGEGNYCLGGVASNIGGQAINTFTWAGTCNITTTQGCDWDTNPCPVGQYCIPHSSFYAQLRIRNLFAQSYGLYVWNTSLGRYELYTNSIGLEGTASATQRWFPPKVRCTGDIRPVYSVLQPTTTYCGIPPKVRNIKLGDGTSNTVNLGSDGGKVKLSFNTVVDEEQQPLKKIYINWGDGKMDSPSFGYKSKDDPSNPHVYTHAYDGCNDCTHIIKILVEDSWGWCSAEPEGRDSIRTCEKISQDVIRPYWDPVDSNSCRSGSCSSGVCVGGMDNGRPCGDLTVELKD